MSESVPASPQRQSPLHDSHAALGARMVPFAGWEMPVQYTSIVDEHKAVRDRVGVFDISHMGQFIVSGPDAPAFLNRALTNDITKLEIGQGQYSLLLNDNGGIIDDLILYRTSDKEYFLVVNASMVQADWAQLKSLQNEEELVQMANISDATAGLAIQGPRSRQVFQHVFGSHTPFPPRNSVFISMTDEGFMWLCGTGYTGEEGFEFFMPVSSSANWFTRIVEAVHAEEGLPCGLGSRDTLRLEMGYPLNGNDLSPDRTPFQAGLGFFVAMEKEDFVGKTALTAQKAGPLQDRLTAFRMTGTTPPPRPHYPVLINGEVVGEVASGTQSPSLGVGIGMAYLPLSASTQGTALEIEIRGRRFPAEVVKKPFYRKSTP